MDPLEGLRAGDRIAEKFCVERVLGEGGMGVVYLARHEVLGERFAIKVLRKDAASAEAVTRFFNEARAAARVRNEHIAAVTDVGSLDDGSVYMVVEYLEGKDLSRLLEDEGPLAPERAVDYLLQALEGLAHAHACGIVHRDLKPGNLFLASQRGGGAVIKVLDFGVSKLNADQLAEHGQSGVTSTKAMLGSPGYMSPEQVRSSRDVDARSDLWSIGVILYRLLTATAPFDADTLGGVLAAILETTPKPITSVRGEVPVGLARVIDRCLAKDPNARWQNAYDLAEALAPYAPPGASARVDHVRRLLSLDARPGDAAAGDTAKPIHGEAAAPKLDPQTQASPMNQAEGSLAANVAPASTLMERVTPAKRTRTRGRRLRLALVALGLASAGAAATFFATRPHLPKSCADLASRRGATRDALYMVDPDGPGGPVKPFQVYCKDMNTDEPKDYLPLEHTYRFFPSSNFTRVQGGRCGREDGTKKPCATLVLHFTKVRIDVSELTIAPGNLTFTEADDPAALACWREETGVCQTYASTHFGTANDCAGRGPASAANINLGGTPFVIDPSVTYEVKAFDGDGGATFDDTRTTVDVIGGGYCGATAPTTPLRLKQR